MARARYPVVSLVFLLAALVPGFGFQSPFAEAPATITPRPRPASVQNEAEKALERKAVLRIDSSLVVVPTWVTTANGSAVTNLKKGNFHVLEDNVEQPITYFNRDDAPLSIGLLFDKSGSMRNKMDKASEAVAEFFKTANTDDEFFLVEFSDSARLTVPFTSDSSEISSRISRVKPEGRTALLDAIDVALKQMKKARHMRKAIVIISDGGDNWSRHTAREVRRTLVESDVQLYAMGIFDPDLSIKSPVENRNGPALLDDLAAETGGRHYPVADLNDLPAISAKIGNDLRNEYVIGYYPPDSRDGKYHHIKVTVAPAAPVPLRANYRHGYYAPVE